MKFRFSSLNQTASSRAAKPPAGALETVNGGISLEVPSNLSADLSAHVTNGGIHVDDVLKFEAVGQQTRRSVEGKLNGGGRRLEASTTNGGIRIHAK